MKRDERSLGNGTTSRADLGMLKGGGKGVGGGAHSVQGRRKQICSGTGTGDI